MKLLHIQLLSVCLMSFSFLGLMACREERRKPSRYLIPDGYVGWVRIDYNMKDAPPLPVEDGFCLMKFPTDGHLRTSSLIEYGWAQDEGSQEVNEQRHEGFFVGREEQFNKLGLTNKDENGNPKVGPIPL